MGAPWMPSAKSMPIEVGQPVRIVQVKGTRVVVRAVEDEPSSAPPDPLQRTYDDPFELPRLDTGVPQHHAMGVGPASEVQAMVLLAQQIDRQTIVILASLVAIVLALVVLFFFARYFKWWIQSITTGAGIGIFDLIGMRLRKVSQSVIVRSKIMAVQAGIGREHGVTTKALEAHYLAGGNVPLVIRALIAAAKAKLVELDFKRATAIDLAGRNVLEAVQTSVNPKVIDCPGRGTGKDSLDGVAQNGIQLKVRARVTVRANLRQLIGGATEETIIARVGEGIVSAIGSAESHLHVLGEPRPHLQDGAGPPARRPDGLRDRLHRHRRRGRGREHRRPLAGRPGRGRHAGLPGQGRRPPRAWPWPRSRK